MTHDNRPLSVNGLAQQCRDRAAQPVRRHRTTIYRTAQRLTAQRKAVVPVCTGLLSRSRPGILTTSMPLANVCRWLVCRQ